MRPSVRRKLRAKRIGSKRSDTENRKSRPRLHLHITGNFSFKKPTTNEGSTAKQTGDRAMPCTTRPKPTAEKGAGVCLLQKVAPHGNASCVNTAVNLAFSSMTAVSHERARHKYIHTYIQPAELKSGANEAPLAHTARYDRCRKASLSSIDNARRGVACDKVSPAKIGGMYTLSSWFRHTKK